MRRRWGRTEGWPAALVAGLAVAVGGCHPFDCEDYFLCPASCAGECLPKLESLSYSEPVLLWTGDLEDAPDCPGALFWQASEGWVDTSVGDPSAESACPPCACGQPACQLPEQVLLSAEPLCGGPSVQVSTAPDWDGSCMAAPETLFDVRAIAAQTSAVCTPIAPPAPPAPPATIHGRVCRAWREAGLCTQPRNFCLPPEDPPSSRFRRCVQQTKEVEEACPNDIYPDKVVLHADPPGMSRCPACACEAVGANCIAFVELFDDPVCGGPDLTKGPVSEAPTCVPFRGTGAVTAVAAMWFINDPGVGCVPRGRGESAGTLDREIYCCERREGE